MGHGSAAPETGVYLFSSLRLSCHVSMFGVSMGSFLLAILLCKCSVYKRAISIITIVVFFVNYLFIYYLFTYLFIFWGWGGSVGGCKGSSLVHLMCVYESFFFN